MSLSLFDTETGILRWAQLSDDGQFRYALTRRWDVSRPLALGIGLNPSQADGLVGDLTAVKMIGFAKRWGCGGYALVNAYAFRATDPAELFARYFAGEDAVGPENNTAIRSWLAVADGPVVACWGSTRPGGRLGGLSHDLRLGEVCDLVREAGRTMQCLGTTKDGHPRHPSRLAYATPLVPFEVPS